jgi:very-short-patch-repair endonuclease
MNLFHSATLNDLKDTCLNYKLLKHCQNPQAQPIPIVGMTIDELRLKARQTERRPDNKPSPFDSWFEVDVYLKLADRGYRVIPQYVVNPYEKSYRIDLVVEGLNGRLAVECDGEEWHGPAQYEKDMNRQRELERCGWEFWRVRDGAFYRDAEVAMSTLWDALKSRGIFPEGYVPQVDLVKNESHVQQSSPVNNNGTTSNLHDDQEDSFSNKLSEEEIVDSKKRALDLTPKEIQESLIEVLKRRPNNSIAVKAVASEICREVGVRTRGAPRRDLDKRIKRSIGVLKSQGRVEEYKSKNLRIRLI